jgi:threonine 3-dehydrogenase
VVLTDVAEPTPADDEVLVRVEATSICGTDLAVYEWSGWVAERLRTPRVIGHEFCGTVERVGSKVETIKVGDFVAHETHIFDGTCHQCRVGQRHVCEHLQLLGFDHDGCFADLVTIRAQNAWVTDRSLPIEIASIQEPFGNAVHSALKGELRDQVVLITGCGPIGLFSIAIARAEGARLVIATDVNDYRLDLARKMGADLVIDTRVEDPVAAVRKAAGRGADVALEMSGNARAIEQALTALRPGAWISLLGLPRGQVTLDLNDLVILKGITVHGIFGRLIWETWEQTRRLLGPGGVDISALITHRVGLEDFEEAIQLLKSGECGKIVMFPGSRSRGCTGPCA